MNRLLTLSVAVLVLVYQPLFCFAYAPSTLPDAPEEQSLYKSRVYTNTYHECDMLVVHQIKDRNTIIAATCRDDIAEEILLVHNNYYIDVRTHEAKWWHEPKQTPKDTWHKNYSKCDLEIVYALDGFKNVGMEAVCLEGDVEDVELEMNGYSMGIKKVQAK